MKRWTRTVGLLGLLLMAVLPSRAELGAVVNEKDEPLLGVSACYMVNGIKSLCVHTDKAGVFDLPSSEVGKIRLTLEGYLPQLVDKISADTPVVLIRAAEIWIHLVDPAGTVLDAGEVFLIFPDGDRKGPFPVNVHGVKVRTLPPGDYRVVARSDGYVQQRSYSATLVGGMVAEANVELRPAPAAAPD